MYKRNGKRKASSEKDGFSWNRVSLEQAFGLFVIMNLGQLKILFRAFAVCVDDGLVLLWVLLPLCHHPWLLLVSVQHFIIITVSISYPCSLIVLSYYYALSTQLLSVSMRWSMYVYERCEGNSTVTVEGPFMFYRQFDDLWCTYPYDVLASKLKGNCIGNKALKDL